MRYFLLALIHIYWLIPKRKRRRCIFKESCSHYVYREAKLGGFKNGIAALRERRQQCKPGYYFIDELVARMADKSIVPVTLLNENI